MQRAIAVGWLAALLLALSVVGCSGEQTAVPRIILVTLDTTRADRLGCYGYADAATPRLDRFAETAMLFEQVVSPVPTTLPSHSTMFTGLYPQDHGVRYNLVFRLGPQAQTLAERLRDAGFATAAFPASYILSRRFGLDQGFEVYSEPPGGAMTPEVINGLPAAEVVNQALGWLEQRSPDEKLFLWVHFYDPHAPYRPPFPFASEFRARPYDGEIAYADAQFGRLLDALERLPGADETVVIVAGDHGEGLHDHRERFHAYLLYESTQGVPLIVDVPGLASGRVTEPVGLVDLMPTVLDLAGLDVPPDLRGTSLVPALRGAELPRRDLYFESLAGSLNYGWAELRGVRYGAWKLIDSEDPELFNLAEDPSESDNLASREPRRLDDLRAVLRELAEPVTDAATAVVAHDPALDSETERFLASLGYVAGGSGGSAEGAPHPRSLIDLEPELLAGQASVALGQWRRLEDVCRYVLGRDPTNKWSLSNLVMALVATERAAEAEELAADFVRLYPDNEQAYVRLAESFRAQGEMARAEEVLQRGLAAVPDAARLTYLRIVNGFDAVGDAVCEERVPAAVAAHPSSGLIRVMQARCQARAGEPEAALETLREAVARGFAQLRRLGENEEFADVVALAGFAELVEPAGDRAAEPPSDAAGEPP